MGLRGGLAAGQVMVAHAEEYIYTEFGNRADSARAPGAASFTRAAHAFVIPNLSAYEVITEQWGKPSQVDAFLRAPSAAYLSPRRRQQWRDADYVSRFGSLGRKIDFLRWFTKVLSDSGVPLLLGTDAPGIPGMAPGFAIHEDLRNMILAGLTPYQALVAGTRAPGEFIWRYVPRAERFGIVAGGYRADLILVNENPLRDVTTLKAPVGVMVRGRWLGAAVLRRALDSLRT